MSRIRTKTEQRGFTLIELLTALGIFLLVCGAAFTLLGTSQQRYQTDAQVLNSFQEARLGLDQIVRDVNDSGYPSPSFNDGVHTNFTDSPFAWSTGYPTTANPTGTPCTIGGNCITPGDFDLIIETKINPQDPGVSWVRYQLQQGTTTLVRGTALKTWNQDPDTYTTNIGQFAPFVQNVVNNAPTAQMIAAYPGMFPGGNPVPIFSYTCDTPTAPQPQPQACPAALADNSPRNIRDVVVTLIVAAPLPDATTGQPRLVQLSGRGRRINPNQ